MVKEILVTLSEDAPKAGGELLKLLDAVRMEISDAFWWFVDEEQSWRLVLATPLVEDKGPIELYTLVRAALDQMTEEQRAGLRLRDTAIVTPDDYVVRMLRHAYGSVKEGRGQRVRRMNVAQDEPFVYRLAADGTD